MIIENDILSFKDALVHYHDHERIYIKNDEDLLCHLFHTNFRFENEEIWYPKDKNLYIIANLKTRLLSISYEIPQHTQQIQKGEK